jgi:hypothetical protein
MKLIKERRMAKSVERKKACLLTRIKSIVATARKIPDEMKISYEEENKDRRDTSGAVWPYSCLVGGALLTAVFLPLTCLSSIKCGLNPVDVILFTHTTVAFPGGKFSEVIQFIFGTPHLPTLFSMGLLYGLSGVLAPFILLHLDKKGIIELMVLSNGLLLGYELTYLVGKWLGRITIPSRAAISNLNFMYILYLFVIALILIEKFGKMGIRAKFDHLFLGVHGILSGWILSKAFGMGSIAFTGMAFIIITFISIVIT